MTHGDSRFLRGILTLTLSRYVVRALSVVKGLVVARFLGPDLYGVYGLLVVFVGYSAYADLGIFGGLTKDLPVHLAHGEDERARSAQAAGLGAILAATALFAVVTAAALYGRNPAMKWSVVALAFDMLAQQAFKYETILLRVRNRFTEAAFAFTLLQVFDVVFILVLLFPFRVTGVFLGQGLAFLTATWILNTRYRFPFRLAWNPRLAARLVGQGFPLVVATVTFLLFQTVDRFLIVGFLDTTSLGHYMIGVFSASLIYYIPQSLGYVLFPSFRERLAGLAEGARPPARYVDFPARILSYLLPPLTSAIFLGIPVLGLLLPAYLPGLGSARILVMGTFFLSLVTSASSLLIAAEWHRPLMKIQAVAVGLDLLLNLIALRSGRGIEGVAAATAVSYLVYASASLFLAYRCVGWKARAIVGRLLVLFAPFAYCLAVVLFLRIGVRPSAEWGVLRTVALREVLFVVLLLPGTWVLQRTTGAVTEIRNLFHRTWKP